MYIFPALTGYIGSILVKKMSVKATTVFVPVPIFCIFLGKFSVNFNSRTSLPRRRAGTRDEPLRTSAWEATLGRDGSRVVSWKTLVSFMKLNEIHYIFDL